MLKKCEIKVNKDTLEYKVWGSGFIGPFIGFRAYRNHGPVVCLHPEEGPTEHRSLQLLLQMSPIALLWSMLWKKSIYFLGLEVALVGTPEPKEVL